MVYPVQYMFGCRQARLFIITRKVNDLFKLSWSLFKRPKFRYAPKRLSSALTAFCGLLEFEGFNKGLWKLSSDLVDTIQLKFSFKQYWFEIYFGYLIVLRSQSHQNYVDTASPCFVELYTGGSVCLQRAVAPLRQNQSLVSRTKQGRHPSSPYPSGLTQGEGGERKREG